MKITFIIKNLSQKFYEGSPSICGEPPMPSFNAMTPKEKFYRLSGLSGQGSVTRKIETGQIRDQVELNMMLKSGNCSFECQIEPRRGYRLATFDVTLAAAARGQIQAQDA